jgi:hypothetical protein
MLILFILKLRIFYLIILYWGLGIGIGDWGLGIGPNPQSPIPNPQSPIPKIFKITYFYINN